MVAGSGMLCLMSFSELPWNPTTFLSPHESCLVLVFHEVGTIQKTMERAPLKSGRRRCSARNWLADVVSCSYCDRGHNSMNNVTDNIRGRIIMRAQVLILIVWSGGFNTGISPL